MYQDQEINALNDVYEALVGLKPTQIKRIVEWLSSKYNLEKQKTGIVSTDKEVSSPAAALVEVAPPADETAAPVVKKRRGRPPGNAEPAAEISVSIPKPAVGADAAPGVEGFLKFDTFEDLFFSSNAKSIAAAILLAASYLQERHNSKTLNTSEINAQMKKVGQQVQNISASINNLLTKKPPLLVQTGKLGDSKQARRQYRVTEEGLRIARNYINE
jgi:hypothetical protein